MDVFVKHVVGHWWTSDLKDLCDVGRRGWRGECEFTLSSGGYRLPYFNPLFPPPRIVASIRIRCKAGKRQSPGLRPWYSRTYVVNYIWIRVEPRTVWAVGLSGRKGVLTCER